MRTGRRGFLRLAAGGSLTIALGLPGRWAVAGETPDTEAFAPVPFLRIPASGRIRLSIPKVEMGQQITTALTLVLCEELDVLPEQVEVRTAPADAAFGDQNTEGSASVRTLYAPLREAARAARRALIRAAARRWSVAETELVTERGEVVHPPSGRRARYQSLAVAAAALAPVTEDASIRASSASLIGSDVPPLDGETIANGTLRYTGDLRLPGMVYASVERAPTANGTIVGFDAQAARAVPGVIDVFPLPAFAAAAAFTTAGIAVVATSTWAALRGRAALAARFRAEGPSPDQDVIDAGMRARLERDGDTLARSAGNIDAAFDAAVATVDLRFETAAQAHAAMEPPVCVIEPGATRWRVWAPTQRPQSARRIAAQIAGLAPEAVELQVPRLGGGFGRKSKSDFVAEAASIARRIGRPVQVFWTRSDDLRHDYYRPPSAQRIRAALAADGGIAAWHHHSVFPSVGRAFDPDARGVGAWELSQGASSFPFETGAIRVEGSGAEVPYRVGWARGVHHVAHGFAVGVAMDALARAAKTDPIAWHRRCLGARARIEIDTGEPREPVSLDGERLHRLLDGIETFAEWSRRTPGVGRGFAMLTSYRTPVAVVVRAAVDDTRRLSLLGVWAMLDCGRVVYPDGARAQVEGAVAEALAAALWQRVATRDGAVMLSGFEDHRLMTASRMCPVHVRFLESDAAPTGVGEVAVAPVAPALSNAIFDAIAERHCALPLLDDAHRLRPSNSLAAPTDRT